MIPPSIAASAASVVLALSPPLPIIAPVFGPVSALEIIKVYGSLAGPECYGRTAPSGSSCQLPLSYLQQELGLLDSSPASGEQSVTTSPSSRFRSLARDEFGRKLESLPFRWPLKPFGLTNESLRKTATANKGAETALYMDELERRGLYDRRNPAGPLPTSLRPKLNEALDREGVDGRAADAVFRMFSGGGEEITVEGLREAFQGAEALDYYGFIELVGSDNIRWPRKEW